ncbi:dirp, partial [Ancylostoma caninum]
LFCFLFDLSVTFRQVSGHGSSARRVLDTSTPHTSSHHISQGLGPLQENVSHSNSIVTRRSGQLVELQKMDRLPIDRKSPIMLLNTADVNASSFAPIRNELQPTSIIAPTVVTRHSAFQQPSRAVTRVVEESYSNTPESSRSSFDDDASEATRNALLKKIARHKSQNEIGSELQCSLRRIRNLLKLPKARRWVICEFFYSGVDEQLFLGDNEFRQLIREAFPNLKTMQMNKQEWRVVRRLLGRFYYLLVKWPSKPRRCSTTFFDEERRILDQRRRKVRGIYDGSYTSIANCDLSDMPPNLPAPLVVGMKVYARLRTPKDGIYGGTIDALVSGGGGYRIVFDKEDMIPPSFVPDYEVMYDGSLELLSLSYFLQQNNARLPVAVCTARTVPVTYPTKQKKSSEVNHEKVGNFPVRMLVILVKVAKLLDIKRKLVKTLTELNNEAERESILTDKYTSIFQERYARTVVDLETVNRQVNIYLNGIQEYNSQLLPQLSEVSISARPEALRRMCASHANQIFKHCNRDLNVSNPQAVRLITALTSLLLQIRSLGQQKMTPMDLTALSESINEIRQMISPKNYNCFQDHVEVHMRQVHNVMLKSGSATS